jgi:hypothetical protein
VNWPWGGPEDVSFLMPTFLGAAASHDGNGTLNILVQPEGSYLELKSSRFVMKQNMTHFVLMDGEPVLKTFDPSLYRLLQLAGETPLSFFFPFGLCRANDLDSQLPHWDVIEYDPQFSSLFVDSSLSNPATNSPLISPAKKASNKAVAIATGTTFGIVGAAVAVVLIYVIFFHKPASAQTVASHQKNQGHASTSPAVTRQ